MRVFAVSVSYALLLFTCFTSTSVQAAAIDEVNLFRTTHGLRPFKHDPQLTAFAQHKAEYRAARMLKDGHQGPQNPPGTTEGTAEATAMWGWLSCSMEEDWEYAGAGIAIGGDGERYMVLVARGGTGAALRGRSLRPVPTAHLTPNPPRFDRYGNRVGGGVVMAAPAKPAATVAKAQPTAPAKTVVRGQSVAKKQVIRPVTHTTNKSVTTTSNAKKTIPVRTVSTKLQVGQRDHDGAIIIRVGR